MVGFVTAPPAGLQQLVLDDILMPQDQIPADLWTSCIFTAAPSLGRSGAKILGEAVTLPPLLVGAEIALEPLPRDSLHEHDLASFLDSFNWLVVVDIKWSPSEAQWQPSTLPPCSLVLSNGSVISHSKLTFVRPGAPAMKDWFAQYGAQCVAQLKGFATQHWTVLTSVDTPQGRVLSLRATSRRSSVAVHNVPLTKVQAWLKVADPVSHPQSG